MNAVARWWTRQWGRSADLRYQDANLLFSVPTRRMTAPNLPDPRFDNRVLIYDPEAIKTALSTYFHALSRLPYIEASDIVSPSAAGWPNITATNFAPLGKNSTVIALLKHLPYLRNPGLPKGYTIAFETFAIDYSAALFTEPLDGDSAEAFSPSVRGRRREDQELGGAAYYESGSVFRLLVVT
jgi:hypothetical protein